MIINHNNHQYPIFSTQSFIRDNIFFKNMICRSTTIMKSVGHLYSTWSWCALNLSGCKKAWGRIGHLYCRYFWSLRISFGCTLMQAENGFYGTSRFIGTKLFRVDPENFDWIPWKGHSLEKIGLIGFQDKQNAMWKVVSILGNNFFALCGNSQNN